MHVFKIIRNVVVSAILLTVLFFGIGIAYILVQNPSKSPQKVTTNVTTNIPGPLTPTPPGLNAREGVAIEGMPPSIKVGESASVNAQTNAGSTCKIIVDAHVVISDRSVSLQDKIADAYGSVAWTWGVGSTTLPGNYSLTITCLYHNRAGIVQGNFEVQKA
jgi:hypothetical protein